MVSPFANSAWSFSVGEAESGSFTGVKLEVVVRDKSILQMRTVKTAWLKTHLQAKTDQLLHAKNTDIDGHMIIGPDIF